MEIGDSVNKILEKTMTYHLKFPTYYSLKIENGLCSSVYRSLWDRVNQSVNFRKNGNR